MRVTIKKAMEDQIYITMAKVLHGEASDAERIELDAWLQTDQANAAIFAEMKAMWSGTDALFDAPRFDAAPAWEKVSGRIHQPAMVAPPAQRKTIALPTWVKYSSAIAAILLIALFIWNPFNKSNVRVVADNGNRRVELPDHSVITLRKGSTLSYPQTFAANERNVALEGEAFFEVRHNEQQPFVIDAQAVSVKVLGTTFNVQCGDGAADVTVTTGRVQVTAQTGPKKIVILTPGNAAHYRQGNLTQGTATGTEAFWKSGTLSFNNEPFTRVVAAIAAAKDTAIQLDAGLSPAQRQQAITVTFRNQTLEDMLTELCLITNCRWQKAGKTYIIRTK